MGQPPAKAEHGTLFFNGGARDDGIMGCGWKKSAGEI
jgi:hypothetical protein